MVIRIDEDFRDLTEGYLKNVDLQLGRLRDLLKKRDFVTILDETHKMAGAGQSYGFEEITVTARKIDTAVEKQSESEIAVLIEELARYLQNLEIEYVPEDDL